MLGPGPAAPSSNKRPLPIDWQMKWREARSENISQRGKFRALEYKVTGLEDFLDDARKFIEDHNIDSMKEVDDYVNGLEKEIEERDADLSELSGKNEDLIDQCKAYQSNMELQTEQVHLIRSRMEELAASKVNLESELAQLQTENASIAQRADEDARALKTKYEETSAELADSIKQLSDFKSEHEKTKLELVQNADNVESERQEACRMLAQLEEDKDTLERAKQALEFTIESSNEQIGLLVATIDEREADLAVKNQTNEELSRSLDSLKDQYASQQEYIEKLQQQNYAHQSTVSQISQLEATIESLESQVSNFVAKENETSELLESLQAEVISHERDLSRLLAENKELQEHAGATLATASERQTYIMLLESIKQDLEKKIIDIERKYSQQTMLLEVNNSDKSEAAAKVEQLNAMLQDVQESLAHKNQQMAETEGLVSEKMDIIKDQRSTISAQKTTINEQKLRIETHENAKMIEKDHIRQNEELRRQINSLQDSHQQGQQKLQLESNLRRSMQEKLLELKGTIRVFCRVRPLLGHEMSREGTLVFDQQLSTVCVSQVTNGHNKNTTRVSKFSFDQVFDATSTNEDIFQEVDLLIQSIFNGFSCCIFAYGQTGSGKSHTMLSTDGIVYRTISCIFDLMKIIEHNLKNTVSVSFFEIYNEQVVDLVPAGSNSRASPVRSAALTGVHEHIVEDTQGLTRILEVGLKNRAVGATKMNKDSSRSHTVYSIRVQSVSTVDGSVTNGTLNLIDLAGSERLDKSQVTGQQLKETQAINKSLSALGDVIHALGQQPRVHIPFRNSKLTHMLQASLTGKSKTLMLVNVSPALSSIQETVTTLRFAEKVNSTKLREVTNP